MVAAEKTAVISSSLHAELLRRSAPPRATGASHLL